ncbi:DNA methyltransferase [Corynebacterium matruchotii]|uniref:DNA methyltransferase n=1 Tax=Corynebacterium matruchotii TaxID=43768 RepID=UPI0037BE63F7
MPTSAGVKSTLTRFDFDALLCRACLVWGLGEELVRKLVFASSQVRDMVLDPVSGSGTTAVVTVQLG